MHSHSKGQSCSSKNKPESNPSFTHSSYIGTSYLLASTVFLPLFASIADIYGRHFGLQLSLLFFLVGSALSTGAVNMPMILAGRGIAGIGAAGLLTVRSFPCLHSRGLPHIYSGAALHPFTHLRTIPPRSFFWITDRSNSHVRHDVAQREQCTAINAVFALFGRFQYWALDWRVLSRGRLSLGVCHQVRHSLHEGDTSCLSLFHPACHAPRSPCSCALSFSVTDLVCMVPRTRNFKLQP